MTLVVNLLYDAGARRDFPVAPEQHGARERDAKARVDASLLL
jgi:hypothetical protein